MGLFSQLSSDVRQYLLVTGNYWAFTLTDGALRMLVVLHFHSLGYTPLQIAALFLFYEIFGVVTNLLGGYLGARLGLNRTMNIGLGLQVGALLMLTVPAAWLTIPWVMGAQALSGIAKDLNKMSAKSSIKLLVPDGEQGRLYQWVAILTGSKNALKGVGFFLGGALLALLGFAGAVLAMAAVLALIWLVLLAPPITRALRARFAGDGRALAAGVGAGGQREDARARPEQWRQRLDMQAALRVGAQQAQHGVPRRLALRAVQPHLHLVVGRRDDVDGLAVDAGAGGDRHLPLVELAALDALATRAEEAGKAVTAHLVREVAAEGRAKRGRKA